MIRGVRAVAGQRSVQRGDMPAFRDGRDGGSAVIGATTLKKKETEFGRERLLILQAIGRQLSTTQVCYRGFLLGLPSII